MYYKNVKVIGYNLSYWGLVIDLSFLVCGVKVFNLDRLRPW